LKIGAERNIELC